ncbi:MAG TPA: glycosyltransferase [Longimicrobiaceae bacterium]
MRILFAGVLWKGSTCVYRAQALSHLGHAVTEIETAPPDPARERTLANRVRNRLGFPPDLAGANRALLRAAREGRHELVWIEKGRTIRPSTLRALRRILPGARLVSYSCDDMVNPRNQSRAYRAGLAIYDLLVTTKTYNVAELTALGARDVIFNGNAYHPPIHRPLELTPAERERWGSDVVFVGQYERERHETMMALVDAGVRVTVHGPDWARFRGAHPGFVVGEPWVADDDYARVVSGSRISLGFLRKANRDLQTQRSVEIPACGGFMLAERTAEHLELFEEGLEAEYFEGTGELIDKVRYYLDHEDERQRVAAAGRERCLRSGYSYAERLAEVLGHLGLGDGSGGATSAARRSTRAAEPAR